MKHHEYDSWVRVQELIPPIGENKFVAFAEIHEIGHGKVDHGLNEVWGKTREEAHDKMKTKIQQWIQVNEK